MKVTINGITYEGTVDEIRQIVSNQPIRIDENDVFPDNTSFKRNWDGSPVITCWCRDIDHVFGI